MEPSALVFSGGGMRGIAYVGAFKELRKRFERDQIKYVGGVSIGAVFSLFWVLGYTYSELCREIKKKDFRFLTDPKLSHLFDEWGLDRGTALRSWVETFLLKRGIDRSITFKELWQKIPITLGVVATNLNRGELEMFSKDTTPDLPIIDAVMRSMRIPFFFTAKEKDITYIDGAIISNLPIELCMESFKIEKEAILGLHLESSTEIKEIKDLKDFIWAISRCMSNVINRETCKSSNIIRIDISNYPHLDFKMTRETKRELIEIGLRDTLSFFN